jgi:hypothetical protein
MTNQRQIYVVCEHCGIRRQVCTICEINDGRPLHILYPPFGSRDSNDLIDVCKDCFDKIYDAIDTPEKIKRILDWRG